MVGKSVRAWVGSCAVALAIGCAVLYAAEPIASKWRDREIHIDGINDDWSEAVAVKKAPSVAVVNDGDNLYIEMVSSDQRLRRQLSAEGVTVWLDSRGGTKPRFGIEVPGARALLGRGPTSRGAVDAPPDIPTPLVTYFYLLGPKSDDRRRIEVAAKPPVEVVAGSREGTLVFEFKIPLSGATIGARDLDLKPGALIGLGIETPKFERPSRAGGPGGPGAPGGVDGGDRGGFGGGRGRMGGGRAGGGGGYGRGDMEPGQRTEPIKAWLKVRLAKSAASSGHYGPMTTLAPFV